MRLVLLAIVGAITALSDVASAQNKPVDRSLDAIDFLVDAPDLIGKRVTVTGCSFGSASSTSVVCRAPNNTGSIFIESGSMDRESLRRALKTCAGYEQHAHCRGSVTGIVSSGIFSPRLGDATIDWAQ
jgi:predicted peptidase